MTHKAFEVIGPRIYIDNTDGRRKEGIFQESKRFRTTAEGAQRPALDFIEPIYDPDSDMENLAKGLEPRERINLENPILSLHLGIDHLQLNYKGFIDGFHIFRGNLIYVQGAFVNDGNSEIYDQYKEPLKHAHFKIH